MVSFARFNGGMGSDCVKHATVLIIRRLSARGRAGTDGFVRKLFSCFTAFSW